MYGAASRWWPRHAHLLGGCGCDLFIIASYACLGLYDGGVGLVRGCGDVECAV